MRLTLVGHDVGGVGGMERVLERLVVGLLDRGHDVTVVARSCELPAHARMRWLRVPGPARPFPVAYPWFFLVGSLAARRAGGDVILSTGAIIANREVWSAVHLCHHATGVLGSRRQSRPTPAHRVSANVARVMSLAGERFCYRPRRTVGLIGVSRGVSAELAEHFPDLDVFTVPNGVDTSRFAPSPPRRAEVRARYGLDATDRVALFVGGEWEGKGLRHALAALVYAPSWRLMVVGAGDQATYCEYAEHLGVAERVRFVGRVDDPAPYFCAGDAFVLPSAYETFSLVTYEAAACGLALLVTPVSGVTDLLRDGVNGWFITPDASDIGAKLRALDRERTLIADMGGAARVAAGAFTWERMVSAYDEILGSPQRAGTPHAFEGAPAVASTGT